MRYAHRRPTWIVGGLLVLLLSAPVLVRQVTAQDAEAPLTKKADNGAKVRGKSRGRLPLYYARVVNDEQREQIYELQTKYEAQIAELLAEVRAAEAERDEAIQAVLTAEQQAQVAEMVEDARKRRQALRSAEQELEAERARETEDEADDS